jgi:hypothetical protein
MLGIGLNSIIQQVDITGGDARGTSGWKVAQEQCNPETEIIIFGSSLQFWQLTTIKAVSSLPAAMKTLILVL